MNETIDVTVDLVNASTDTQLPATEAFTRWTRAALDALHRDTDAELSIRVVDEAESATLNSTYRHKSGPTNVLSFPYAAMAGMDNSEIPLLGDLAICAPLVRQEAEAQQKTVEAHWAHLTVHGVLHLNGMDHEEAEDAAAMESLEIHILDTLGFANPYQLDDIGNE